MGYQENFDLYLNFSRKELQELCKKHSLPANRSKDHLAKSLASFFKRRSASPAPLGERSSRAVEFTFSTPSVPQSKPDEPANPVEETERGAYERRTNASESDSYGPTSSVKEKEGHERRHLLSGNQVEIKSPMETLDKVLNTAEDVDCACPSISETTGGFGCSTSEPGNVHIKPLVDANRQEITAVSQLRFDCHNGGKRKESYKSSELRNSGPKFPNHASTSTGMSDLAVLPCGHKRVGKCSTESGFLSSDKISTEMPPAFQFFVTSEEGINLYVDLSSSPSEWIKNLKGEVCIYPKACHCKSQTLCNHIRDIADADEHMKTSSSRNTGTCFHTKGVVSNTGYINSSFTSDSSESCHSEAFPPDVTDGSSRSSALISSSTPVKLSECFEGNKLVSSSCVTNLDVQNNTAFDVLSCPGDEKMLSQDSAASFRIQKRNASVLDASLNQSISNIDVNFSPDGTRYPMSGAIQDNTKASGVGKLENHSGAGQVSPGRGPMEVFPEAAGHHNNSSISCQVSGQLVLDYPMTDAQSDVGYANYIPNQHVRGGIGNFVAEDPTSAFNDDWGRRIPVKDKDSSECSQFQKTLDMTFERVHSAEFPEEFQGKKQHANGENKNGTMMHLRSSKAGAKDSTCDPIVFPRRSSRLVSK